MPSPALLDLHSVANGSPANPTLTADCIQMREAEHFVQFYEDDAFLVESVAEYVGGALGRGNGAIVIATLAHRESLEERLEAQGIDLPAVRSRGQYVPLDAAEVLSRFMVDGTPDAGRFADLVGGLVETTKKGRRGLSAFGEMVALLWAAGNGAAAIKLEKLWNELAKVEDFSLFCAYPLNAFGGPANGEPFLHICAEHSRVVPAESYAARHRGGDERLRAIALLQQKAVSLEAEVAERIKAEEALWRCNQELTSFFENATVGLHWVREDGTIKWANRAEYELLGYSREEYIGHHIAEFHADERVIANILARLGRAETLTNFEARLRHKDGSIKHVLIDSNVLWDEGRFVHTQCFTRDITEQKIAEQKLRETGEKLALANAQLEERVAERTAKLQETITELEAFSYSVSHDMRAPLRAMQAHAKMLLDDYRRKLEPEGINSLERIARSATRLDTLIRDILAYSKVSKGQIGLKTVALDSLTEEVLRERFGPAREFITVERPSHDVMGHEAYLAQCLTNLLENALKFVASGTFPQVRVRSERTGDKVKLSISDNGIGIDPEHYDRIFKIFGRVYSEKEYSGTGIGLCIVKRAAARMGGAAGFDSQPGKGSEFWITLSAATTCP